MNISQETNKPLINFSRRFTILNKSLDIHNDNFIPHNENLKVK